MKTNVWKLATIFLAVLCLTVFGAALSSAKGPGGGGGGGGGGGKPTPESGSNNLSYPVIWAEGVTKTLPGTAGMDPNLNGVWWYQWGTNGVDPDVTPASCPPDPDESNPLLNQAGLPLCDDGVLGTVDLDLVAGTPEADNPLDLAKAFVQKDANNVWQAGSDDWSATPVDVHWIDWGDNLESVDWYTRSQVRTEVVLFQDLDEPMLEYEMRHTSGWGIDEVHGLAADPDGTVLVGPGTRATIYSHCARLTIQKLLVDRDDPLLADLVWLPGEGWTEPEGYEDELINPHIFNGSVHEGGDGPGYYSAEINVKGRIIYGYTWNVRQLNDGAGDYRITFSFDESCGAAALNTYFVNEVTEIIVPLEEDLAAAAAEEGDDGESPGGGATGVLVPAEFDEDGFLIGGNLTYMDVRILERGGGGGAVAAKTVDPENRHPRGGRQEGARPACPGAGVFSPAACPGCRSEYGRCARGAPQRKRWDQINECRRRKDHEEGFEDEMGLFSGSCPGIPGRTGRGRSVFMRWRGDRNRRGDIRRGSRLYCGGA